jgi:hypothetical protein
MRAVVLEFRKQNLEQLMAVDVREGGLKIPGGSHAHDQLHHPPLQSAGVAVDALQEIRKQAGAVEFLEDLDSEGLILCLQELLVELGPTLSPVG